MGFRKRTSAAARMIEAEDRRDFAALIDWKRTVTFPLASNERGRKSILDIEERDSLFPE